MSRTTCTHSTPSCRACYQRQQRDRARGGPPRPQRAPGLVELPQPRVSHEAASLLRMDADRRGVSLYALISARLEDSVLDPSSSR